MRKHLNIRVHGRVQGVFFRSSAKHSAKKLGIRGFVRNEPDGTVYIEAEGDEENLERFLGWCRKGPPFARVDKVEMEEEVFKNFADFSIL